MTAAARLIAVAPLLLAGCAGPVSTTLPADHPANPQAAKAPLEPGSDILRVQGDPPPDARVDAPPGSVEHGEHQ